MTHQQPGQWLASKLIGTTVVGPNNESIGDVNDVLMERDGHAAAVIVGVGGFLGIGEKDVAISFDHIELTSRAATNASTAHTTGSTSATSQSSPSTTGSTASTTANGVPDRIMLRMTKQELQNAPKFTRADQRDTSSSGSGGRGTTATAPKQ
ncbi:MAG: PRC-barrel domain-containing protein [Microvirga sp.]